MQNILSRPEPLPFPSLASVTGVWKKMDMPTKIFIFLILGSLWAVLMFGVGLSIWTHQLVIDTSIVNNILLIGGTLASVLTSAKVGVAIHKAGQASATQPASNP